MLAKFQVIYTRMRSSSEKSRALPNAAIPTCLAVLAETGIRLVIASTVPSPMTWSGCVFPTVMDTCVGSILAAASLTTALTALMMSFCGMSSPMGLYPSPLVEIAAT